MSAFGERLLLVLPLHTYHSDDFIYIDVQAANGLRLWLTHFESVTLACPIVPAAESVQSTCPLESIPGFDRLTYVGLPVAHSPAKFLIELPKTAEALRYHISRANYLHFAIGGLWGDWGALGSLLASRAGLRFAVWTDRVESQITKFNSRRKTGVRRLSAIVVAQLMARYERYVIARCTLGLFHGMDCYKAYARYCSNPHLVHDIHLNEEALVSASTLADRLKRSGDGPLRLVYAGRAHDEKGVFDWIEALSSIATRGIAFLATWFGAGPELAAARERVNKFGLGSCIEFPGAIDSHAQLLQRLKTFDAFVFCHKTLESPRCLIEALRCGLPIVGYGSDYAADLIHRNGGGLLTPMGNTYQLSNALASLSSDRALLRALSERALRDGASFTDDAVFRHRADLMKSFVRNAVRMT